MQQAVIDETTSNDVAYETPTQRTYDDLFPALPESQNPTQSATSQGQWNNKMRVGSTLITQVFYVPFEERKFDHSEKFGEGESQRTCQQITKDTGAHIETSSSKDQTLTFLVSGKQNEVLEARRKILTHFQTQASKQISIPVEHHKVIVGKSGQKLKDLEKNTATKIHVPNMHENSDIITITGTKEGIEKAEHEIRVWSEEQSRKALEIVSVPKIYHPFIFGPYNETLNALIAESGARIHVPPQSVMKDEIHISGEKDGVMLAKSRIQAIHAEMEKTCGTVSVEVQKAQHKYVIGPKGNTLADIFKETNVSVEMPPSDSDAITITLRGPHNKLGFALGKVYEKASSILIASIDAPAWLHKYIIGKKGANINQLTKDFQGVHVEFVENKIKIEGPPDQVDKAKAAIEAYKNDLIARFTYDEIQVDSKHLKHIIGKSGVNVNRLKEDTGVAINCTEGDNINTIRIEGTQEGVQRAKTELLELVKKLESEVRKNVRIDQRFYKDIIGSKGSNIKEIREEFSQVVIVFPNAGEDDIVQIRGPKDEVDRCEKHLIKLVKKLSETSYSVDVPIFKQFHKFVIGKAGANIKKIRDETQTKIDLPAEGDNSDVIRITGKKANVEEARDRIQKIQNELANIVTEEVTIDPKFYNSLIGTGGKLIHSISDECGGVSIKFPSAESNSDKVTIRGPKDDVDRAKQQLIELTTERQLSSYSVEVRAKPQHHKFLIGKNGANIKKVRDSTGARIVFPNDQDEDKEVITIIGKQEAVLRAQAELEATIKEIDNITEMEITVKPEHHKHFVARRGEILHRITEQFGGVMISFPRPNVMSDKVTLKGAKEFIEGAKKRIEEIVEDLESRVTIEFVIEQKHHRTVMGARGSKVQAITAEYDVMIKIPDKNMQDSNYDCSEQLNGNADENAPKPWDIIRITGKEENCLAAKEALLNLVPVTIEVEVPFDFHRSIIGQKGAEVRQLMNTYDVHISLSPAEQKSDIIQVTGPRPNAEAAKKAIQEKCEELKEQRLDREARSYELKIQVDPEFHTKLIGRRGAVISKIRKDHNVFINFPKPGDPEPDTITITGYENSTYAARDDIMQIVNQYSDMAKEEISIDPRVYSRLIGYRGRNIKKIMDEFKVEIKFPKTNGPDPSLVTIIGPDDNVQEVKDHLLNLEEEYLEDVVESESRYRPTNEIDFSSLQTGGSGGETNPTGFVVEGGPWEQRTPNTSSVEDFPTFSPRGATKQDESAPVPRLSGAWGSQR